MGSSDLDRLSKIVTPNLTRVDRQTARFIGFPLKTSGYYLDDLNNSSKETTSLSDAF